MFVTLALTGPDAERLLYVRNGQSLNANLHMALQHGEPGAQHRSRGKYQPRGASRMILVLSDAQTLEETVSNAVGDGIPVRKIR